MATVAEVKVVIDTLSLKVDSLSARIIEHTAADEANRSLLLELKNDVRGDGNGKRGIRRELDDVQRTLARYERVTGVATAAAVTAAISALVTMVIR